MHAECWMSLSKAVVVSQDMMRTDGEPKRKCG
jgi:hypothetical protein